MNGTEVQITKALEEIQANVTMVQGLESGDFKNLCFGCFLTFLIIALLLACRHTIPLAHNSAAAFLVNALKITFPNQVQNSWQTLAACVGQLLDITNPLRPAVILLLAPPDAERTARCLASSIARGIAHLLGFSRDFKIRPLNIEPYAVPKEDSRFYDDVHATLRRNKVALIENSQKLHPSSALMLYQLADQAVTIGPSALVLTLSSVFRSQQTMKKSRSMPQELARTYIREAWGNTLSEEVREGILSRITVSPIIVQMEKMDEDIAMPMPDKMGNKFPDTFDIANHFTADEFGLD